MVGGVLMKNVFLICYLNKNLGDDLFVRIVTERFKKFNFVCFASESVDINFYKNNLGVNCWKYTKIKKEIDKVFYLMFGITWFMAKELKKYEKTLLLGGSIFMQSKGWKKSFWLNNIIIDGSKDFNVVGANFGPYKDSTFYEYYYNAFKKCVSVTFRDKYSMDLFSDLSNVKNRPDVVFSIFQEYSCLKRTNKKIGISLIDLGSRNSLVNYKTQYLDFVFVLIKYFLKKDYEIQLFSFCEPEKDMVACEEVFNILSKNCIDMSHILIKNYDGDIDDCLKEISECEYIVGTRFHSIILGWLFEIKTLPIIYSDKTLNVIKDIDSNIKYWDIRSPLDVRNMEIESFFSYPNNIKALSEKSKEQFLCLQEMDGYCNES